MVEIIPSNAVVWKDPQSGEQDIMIDGWGSSGHVSFTNDSYRTDANGFPLATKAAVDAAKQKMIAAILAKHRTIVADERPSAVAVSGMNELKGKFDDVEIDAAAPAWSTPYFKLET